MSILAQARRATSSWHPVLLATSAAMALLALVCVVGLIVDGRTLVGAPIWLKPFKFAVSFTVYTATLAWLLPRLRRTPRLAWWTGNVFAVAAVLEMIAIVMQVVRGRQSHFNGVTPFDAAVFSAMGATVAALWVTNLIVAVVALRQRLDDPVLTSAVRAGLAIAVAGMAVGVLMVLPTPEQSAAQRAGTSNGIVGAHSVGTPDGGPGLAVTGWSTTGGDLRVGHFIGMHALQAVPLLALGLAAAGRRVSRLRLPATRRNLVRVIATGYAAVVGLTTWQALRGQPLLSPDVLTLAFFGGIALAVAVAVAIIFNRATARDSDSVFPRQAHDRFAPAALRP
jgi:hypothetical protein